MTQISVGFKCLYDQLDQKNVPSDQRTESFKIKRPFIFIYIILINSVMGKKLRNREVLTETDYENEYAQDQSSITHSIGKTDIRNKLKGQHYIKKKYNHRKHNKFYQRLVSKQLCEVLNQSTFECPICLQLTICPMMMGCGHIYCARCLESNTAYTKKCCMCRQEQDDEPFVPLKIAAKLIETFILPNCSQTIKYLCRTTDSNQWLRRRKLSNFKQSLIIDFQDHFGKWKRGVISKNVSLDEIQVKSVLNGVEIFEKIKKSSNRIAPFTFFTRGRYLEDFPTILPEHDPTQHQLSHLQYRPITHDDNFFEPIQTQSQRQSEEVYNSEVRDQVLQLFNISMRENDFIFNID